jgi:hypothetical protein
MKRKARGKKAAPARKTRGARNAIVRRAPAVPRVGPRHINVPKPPKKAYNPDRPVSDLVKNQIRYMQAAEQHLPAESRSLMPVAAIMTERDASRYIQHVTQQLHPGATAAVRKSARRPVAAPRKPTVRRKKAKRKPAPRRKK